nr:hypothetical protein [Tanacetum cinerariifolium]
MLPEWGRFVTAVKLNRGLRDSNYDQLYAYLKQHETHAKENKMMLERFSQPTVDPLALLSNNVQGRPNRGQGMNSRGGSVAGYGGAQNRVGNVNQGQARSGQARTVKCYNCNGGQDNAFDDDVDEQPAQDLALNVDNVFQADDCDAFDSDVDAAPTAQTMFIANLSSADPVTDEAGPSYDSDILSKVHDHNQYMDDVCAHHEENVMYDSIQLNHVVDSHTDYTSDSNMIPYDQYVKNNEPALYNGHEIIKDNHTPAIVHNAEDTLEIAEITKKKMNDKMNNPEYVTRKVNISPYDYSKENFLATFTPQKQLTLEQIFWSNDLMKLKFEALKERTKGIQKALTKEIKEMKDVFEELEAEVAKYAVDRKHNAIKRKNLLIANDNLIAECLSQEVFFLAINSELNVARFTEMHVANTTVEARCLALEAELANLRDTNNHDNQKELINHFSKLEELLEYAIGTCPQGSHQRAKQLSYIPLIRKKEVAVVNLSDKSDSTTHRYVVTVKSQQTNVPVPPSTGVNSCPNASRSPPKSHVKPNRISPVKGVNRLPVEDQPRINKSHLRTSNRVDSSSRLKRTVINSNSDSICQTCNKC